MPDVLVLSLGADNNEGSNVDLALITELMWAGVPLRICTRVEEVFSVLHQGKMHIVLIDVCESGADGVTLAAMLRASFHAGIVLFVGPSPAERSRGLDSGADVCFSSGVPPAALIAQLKALSRQMRAIPSLPSPSAPHMPAEPAENDAWILEQSGWSLRAPNGTKVALSRAERALLMHVFQDAEKTIRSEGWHAIHSALKNYRGRQVRNDIRMTVNRLRRKINAMQLDLPVRTRRGIGYQFTGKCQMSGGPEAPPPPPDAPRAA